MLQNFLILNRVFGENWQLTTFFPAFTHMLQLPHSAMPEAKRQVSVPFHSFDKFDSLKLL